MSAKSTNIPQSSWIFRESPQNSVQFSSVFDEQLQMLMKLCKEMSPNFCEENAKKTANFELGPVQKRANLLELQKSGCRVIEDAFAGVVRPNFGFAAHRLLERLGTRRRCVPSRNFASVCSRLNISLSRAKLSTMRIAINT